MQKVKEKSLTPSQRTKLAIIEENYNKNKDWALEQYSKVYSAYQNVEDNLTRLQAEKLKITLQNEHPTEIYNVRKQELGENVSEEEYLKGLASLVAAENTGKKLGVATKSTVGKLGSTAKGIGKKIWEGIKSIGATAWSATKGLAGKVLGG